MRCTERSFLGSRGLVLASVVVAAASISACTSLRTGAGGGLGAAAEGGSRGRLVEELSIGSADGAAEYDLGYVADVALGPGGAILVADNTAGLVREYDANGRFVRSFGGKGGGRGQYISPQFLGVAPDGRVLVGDLPQSGARDAARIHVYSGEGAYLETWDFAHAIEGPLAFDESGVVYFRIAGAAPSSGTSFMRFSAAAGAPSSTNASRALRSVIVIKSRLPTTSPGALRVGTDGAVLDTITAPTSAIVPLQWANDVSGVRVFMVHAYAPVAWYALSPLGHIFSGSSTEYRIDARNTDVTGGRLFQLQREVAPIRVVAEEQEAIRGIIEQGPVWPRGEAIRFGPAEAPAFKPAYHSVLIGREGRIWVGLHLPSVRVSGQWDERLTAFDVWDTAGSYVGRVEGPRTIDRAVIDGDALVSWSWDARGRGRVVRYRIDWN